MRIIPPDIIVSDDEGFVPSKDVFGRAKMGEGLTNLIEAVDDPLVVAIDSPWGSGKTTFLKMWAGDLRAHGFPVIYFDAFAHDWAEDAFVAIAGEIVALAQDQKRAATPAGRRFLKKAIGAGKV